MCSQDNSIRAPIVKWYNRSLVMISSWFDSAWGHRSYTKTASHQRFDPFGYTLNVPITFTANDRSDQALLPKNEPCTYRLFSLSYRACRKGLFAIVRGKRKMARTNKENRTQPSYSWDELYRIYRNAKEAEGLTERTLMLSDKHQGYFLEFLERKYPELLPHEVTTDVWRDWIRYMQKERRLYEGNTRIPDRMKTVGLSPGANNTYLRNQKVFFSFMYTEGYIAANRTKRHTQDSATT